MLFVLFGNDLAYNPLFDGASSLFRNLDRGCSLISLVDVDDIAFRWRNKVRTRVCTLFYPHPLFNFKCVETVSHLKHLLQFSRQ